LLRRSIAFAVRMVTTAVRQRTILGIVLREVTRKLTTINNGCATALARLNTLLERAERIRTQQPKDKNSSTCSDAK
jgi:IS5 family transposase